jgi:hypothetical protein
LTFLCPVPDNQKRNIATAKGVPSLFQSARWKAYLQSLQTHEEDPPGSQNSIWRIYHAEKLWFTQEKNNGHADSAAAHLEESAALLEDCAERVDALEVTLANTPKPSEVLDWSQLW